MNHDTHPVQHGAGGVPPDVLVPALVLLSAACGYLWLVRRARRRNPAQGWSRLRTASALTGLGLLAVALLPPLAPFAHGDFRGHMAQHLLVGMYAPTALVLGAPVTLLLRTLPASRARVLTGVLHSRPARLLSRPSVALLLSAGGLVVLYFTPLYGELTARPAGHWLLHVHFLLAGCLFAHVIAGPDPSPPGPASAPAWSSWAVRSPCTPSSRS